MRITTIKELKRVLPLYLDIREEFPGLINLYAQKEAWARGEMGFFQRLRLAFSIIKGPPISFESLRLGLSIQEHKREQHNMKVSTNIKNCFECPYNRKVREHGATLYTCEHPKLEPLYSSDMVIARDDLNGFPKKCPIFFANAGW